MPVPASAPRTLYDKIWDDHVVSVKKILYINCTYRFTFLSDIKEDGLALVYIDRYVFAMIPIVIP